MRKRFISRPAFQYSMIAHMVGGALVMLGGQALLLLATVSVLRAHPGLSGEAIRLLKQTTLDWSLLLIVLALFIVPVIFVKGVFDSYRLIGGLTRLEVWLERQVAGENVGAFSVRPGDDLEEPVFMLNAIVQRNRRPVQRYKPCS